VRCVLSQNVRELSLGEDQHSIQALSADSADPPLGVGVGLRRAPGGLRNTAMPASANTASKLAMNFVSRSRTKNRNPSARSPITRMRLRACWVTHSPGRVPRNSKDMNASRADFNDEEHVDPTQQHGIDGEERATGRSAGCSSATSPASYTEPSTRRRSRLDRHRSVKGVTHVVEFRRWLRRGLRRCRRGVLRSPPQAPRVNATSGRCGRFARTRLSGDGLGASRLSITVNPR
jgi:hypothetical protein